MLEFSRIVVSEGNYVKKTNSSCECIISHYWYFLDINFNLQPEVCNGCHNLMQNAVNFNDIAFVTVMGNDYRIHFLYINKGEVINLLRNADLTEES